MINVLVVDEYALVRLGIERLLKDEEGIRVVGGVESTTQALSFMRQTSPDVILVDLKLPSIEGLEAIRRLKKDQNVKVITLTAFHNDPLSSRILQAGAAGYLTKFCDIKEMVCAIKTVYSGQRYITPQVAQQLALKSISDTGRSGTPFDVLSDRELQVMLMITSGLKVQEISDKLCLSSKTVNSYRYRVFEKLKIAFPNDVKLTHLAIRYGLLDKMAIRSEVSEESIA